MKPKSLKLFAVLCALTLLSGLGHALPPPAPKGVPLASVNLNYFVPSLSSTGLTSVNSFTGPGLFVQNATASTWAAPKTFPGFTADSVAHLFLFFTFNVGPYNYIYVVWDQAGLAGGESVVFAYDSPINGASLAQHYIGDAGVSPVCRLANLSTQDSAAYAASADNGVDVAALPPCHAAFEAIAPVNGQVTLVVETTGTLAAAQADLATVNIEVVGFDQPNCLDHAVHGHVTTTPGPVLNAAVHGEHLHHGIHGHTTPDACPATPLPTGGPLGMFIASPEAEESLAAKSLPALVPSFSAALNQDGSLNSTAAALGLTTPSAAGRGTVVQLFGPAAGLYLGAGHDRLAGGFTPPVSGEPLYRTSSLPEVSVGGARAKVLYSGLAPGLKGVWQVNVLVPDGAPAGSVPVTMTYEGDIINALMIQVK